MCWQSCLQGPEAERVVPVERQGKYLGILDRLQVRGAVPPCARAHGGSVCHVAPRGSHLAHAIPMYV